MKIFIYIFIAALVSSLVVFGNHTLAASADTYTYTDGSFSFKFPSGWVPLPKVAIEKYKWFECRFKTF
jgi:hypothetical protein